MQESPGNNKQFLNTDRGKTKSNAIQVPSLSLPKGGGAIKGIDEKFAANAINGTTSFSVPLPFSQARGATPSLGLSYSSGAGNGIFGLGWSLSLPSIKRKTEKALPLYHDEDESDTFLFFEAEDLVPEFKKVPGGSFVKDIHGDFIILEYDSPDGHFNIRRYRPRVEGLFARIEKWTHKLDGETSWRIISRDNQTSLFGWTAAGRITDPGNDQRVFEWLPEYVFDDKGNCIIYQYKKEDGAGFDTAALHNQNRIKNGNITYTNNYLQKILYGNLTSYKNFGDPFPGENDFLFSAVFDFGEYDPVVPFNSILPWHFREDAFSDYRSGFEIRTTRLCRRVLFYHHFNGNNEYNGLVRSMQFQYDTGTEQDFTFLKSITTAGHIRKNNGSYSTKKLPPLEFAYQPHDWNREVRSVQSENLVHAPAGIDEHRYLFTDLYNEGLAGILTEQANGWYYKHNLGNGAFAEAKQVTPKPSFPGLGGTLQLADLEADGGKQLVSYRQGIAGFFELDDNNEWQDFQSFRSLPNVDMASPNARMMDLDGDGKPELVISEEDVFYWYPSAGRSGYSAAQRVSKSINEEEGPHILFQDATQSVFLADMSGDGLTDIARIRNGEVCYWPNLGYGRFGRKVLMDNSPLFDYPESFNAAYIRLADIDGSGTTDIIYLGKNKLSCWKNLSGNQFAILPFEIDAFPDIHSESTVTVTDLLGNGVACIVWSSPLPGDDKSPLQYIDLMNSRKPHVMVSFMNNLGMEVRLEYTPSTRFYLDDKMSGNPWITKLHFPVHCLSRTTTLDKISGYKFITTYKYHHGYYDHAEREFRGFGMVEEIASESFKHWRKSGASNIVEEPLHQEPVLSKTWFHTGAFPVTGGMLQPFKQEFWFEEMKRQHINVVPIEKDLTDAKLEAAPGLGVAILAKLTAAEIGEAARACKGMALRSEIFAKDAIRNGNTPDAIKREMTPFTVSTHNCFIEILQPRGKNRYAVFTVKESEAITYSYDRNPEDPRIKHNLNIRMDEYGNILESAAVVYGRKKTIPSLPAATVQEQVKTVIIFSENKFTTDITGDNIHRLRLPSETKTYELKGVVAGADYYLPADFENILTGAKSDEALYHEWEKPLSAGKAQQRLIEHVRSLYYNEDLKNALPLHQMSARALPFEHYQLAYTPALADDIFGTRADPALFITGMYTHSEGDGNWWVRSGITHYLQGVETPVVAANRFFVPVFYTDPFGASTYVRYYGNYNLFIEETENDFGHKSIVRLFDFRTLSPKKIEDINGNLSEVLTDELGLVKAMAVMGKGNEADELTGLTEETDPVEEQLIRSFLEAPDSTALTAAGKSLLQRATTRFVYDLTAFTMKRKPAVAASISREQHASQNPGSAVQISFDYANGMGEVVMKKGQAEPGKARQVLLTGNNTIAVQEIDTASLQPSQLRWIGNGRTVKNNKGNPVKQYEPYFSVTHQYEEYKELVETGVTPILYYDAAGRLVRTDMPDGSFAKLEFDPWQETSWDPNDTVIESAWYADRANRRIDAILLAEGKDPVKEKEAADKAARHAGTPCSMYLDTLGRAILVIEHNKNPVTGADEWYSTAIRLDIESNLREVTDARGNKVMRYRYNMLGNMVFSDSMDSGQRWLFQDISGKPLRSWDQRNHEFRYSYDILQRPVESRILGGDGITPLDNIYYRVFYGESLLQAGGTNMAVLKQKNLLGKPLRQYDTGGLISTPEYDFKGYATSATRKLFRLYKETANWTDARLVPDLEKDEFVFRSETDAMGRIISQEAPDGSVITPAYNEAGLLTGEKVLHPGAVAQTEYIIDIDYNEKGQREKIIFGNDVSTRFYYDRENFRLTRLETKRKNNDPLQDWHYTYDPCGNITHIEDRNVPVKFFNNQKLTGVSEYTYDALYRLTEAKGRENDAALNAQTGDNWNDAPFLRRHIPGDPMAMRIYTQTIRYDAVGNLQSIDHKSAGNNWKRDYQYQSTNNRLNSTTVGTTVFPYAHHPEHGYISSLPHLTDMAWNFREELVKTVTQASGVGTPESTYYQYDGAGQRIRKITENQAAPGVVTTLKEERIYLSGYELYKKHSGTAPGLERTSLSLMDQGHRFLMIEIRNAVNDGTEETLVRYQFHNHLGSCSMELDQDANLISYEEYHPYGTTAYQAMNTTIRAAAKRYRYTGMERDEETGMEYHSARYYLPWLGRWLSADPIGIGDGVNVYAYVKNNPNKSVDKKGTETNETLGTIGEYNLWDVLEANSDRFTVFWDWGKNVNSPGFDIPVLDKQANVVRFFDNKAYTGRISEVSAFSDHRLGPNWKIAMQSIEKYGGEDAEKALKLLKQGNYELVVANYYSKGSQRFASKLFPSMTVLDAETGMFVKSRAELLKARELTKKGINLSGSLGKARFGTTGRLLAGGLVLLATAASAETQIDSAEEKVAEKMKDLVIGDLQKTLASKAAMSDENLLLVDNGKFLLDRSTGSLYGWGDLEEEGPSSGMTMREIAQLFVVNKGLKANAGGKIVDIEHWIEGDNGIRVVHDKGGKELTAIFPKEKGFFESLFY